MRFSFLVLNVVLDFEYLFVNMNIHSTNMSGVVKR